YDPFELRQDTGGECVGRDHDGVRLELVECDAGALDELDTGVNRRGGEAAHPARRVERSVARMEDPAAEQSVERRRKLVDPPRSEAVLPEGVELICERSSLGVVGRQAEAARAAELTAGENIDRIERSLGESPEELRSLRPQAHAGLDVARGAPSQGEASVAA